MTDYQAIKPELTESSANPQTRSISECRDWSLAEYVCTAGPKDRSFEEQHSSFTMAAVVQGTFRYETSSGKSLLSPGSWLLGNHGECFTCGHDHSRGDRCVSLHVKPHYFSEVASSRGVTNRFRFRSPVLPINARDLSLLARTCSLADGPERIEVDELVTEIIENIVGQISGEQSKPRNVSTRDEQRISGVLHYLEDHFMETINLEGLAEQIAMSKFHFLRTFRAVVGRSPYQYLINLRLQRAAHQMINSVNSIADIALGCGFGDLSTFGLTFKRQYGETPSQFRAKYSLKRKSVRVYSSLADTLKPKNYC